MQRDDHGAFDILFDRYWERLFLSERSRLNGSDIAKDIVQEIFIKIGQRRAVLNITGSLENYLQGAVRLSVINHFNSAKVITESMAMDIHKFRKILQRYSRGGANETETALVEAWLVWPYSWVPHY